jgi:2-polyprenyl-3-methyl-5-hydroxy-6-metoxy-1,4-benzoquinol methylase
MQIKDNNVEYIKFAMQLAKEGLVDLKGTNNNYGNIITQPYHLKVLYDVFEEGMTFIDLGCGAGNVLNYAYNIGYNVEGVEWNKDLINKNHNVIHADITKIDPSVWKNIDVIYTYKPLKKGMDEFINKIIKHMKKGAHLITPEYNLITK